MARSTELIIFDWDDVFSQGSTTGYNACYHAALHAVGVELSPDEEAARISARWGQPHREELEGLLAEHPQLLDEAVEAYESNLFGDTFVDELTMVEGSKELLGRLSGNYIMALATGVHPQLLKERVMPKFGLQPEVFSNIVTAYDLDDPLKAKPHPLSAQLIMQSQNITPEYTIMVGDAGNDVRMAQAANIEPVVVLSGHLNRRQAEELGVRHIIPDVSHLETVLDSINR